jgi:DNA-binding LacI/PurR family transcriptional regulator
VTIRDVAREAGVGVGTASRALADSGNVSKESRARVLEAADRLGFRPSFAARAFATGRTHTIGALVPFFNRHYHLAILQGVQAGASADGNALIIYNVENAEQAGKNLRFLASTRRVDALIVVALSTDLVRKVFPHELPFPVVGVDRATPEGVSIEVNHAQGIHLAVSHLCGLSHERIAFIDRFQDPISRQTGNDRMLGYKKALAEAGLPSMESYARLADYSEDGGNQMARELLALPDAPTAIACASDIQAIGAMRAVRERGLSVGDDIAVTGYHDVELARYVGLTTVKLAALEMGQAAAEVAIAMVEGLEPQVPALPAPELVVRESSGATIKAGRGVPHRE